MRTTSFLPVLLAALLVLPAPRNAAAQQADDPVPQVTRTFALENARVVQAPGRVLERATVIVRDGLIVAVGPNAAVPFDAERIAADSLVVYAGFIDGLSHAGIPKPKEARNQERPKDPGNPPDAEAGIQPDRDARALLDPSDNSLEKLRKAGFTAAHVVPYGRMLPGSGAVILLAGDAANALVLKGDASLFAQFEGAPRMYPATDMAVIARMRQLYREAGRRQRMETLYAQNPTGLERPAYDPVHYAFFPVLDGQKPVFFHTENALDVHRALTLRQELGFPLVLAGLGQGFDALEALRQAGVPLLLTLDLPEEPKKPKAQAAADTTAADTTAAPTAIPTDQPKELPAAQQPAYDPDLRTRSHEDVEAEKKNLEARQALERQKYYAAAATLHGAGLAFGFTTMDAKPEDVLKNLRTMVEHGLPEDAALAALTTTPAQMLGLSASMGTVEPGKMANLVVASGPLFDAGTRLRYVFVDGRKFEIEAEKTTAATGEGAANPVGTWSYTVETPQGAVGGTITLAGNPGNLSGTITNDASPADEPATLDELNFDGKTLSFSFDAGQFGRISVTATITGDELEGSLDVPGLGVVPLTGTRVSGPDRP